MVSVRLTGSDSRARRLLRSKNRNHLSTERCHMGDLHWVVSLFLGVVVSTTLIIANKIKEH